MTYAPKAMVGKIGIKEPFTGLFTQGMVTHETYKSEAGSWLLPEEIEKRDGQLIEIATLKPVTVGGVEKMSKSRGNIVDPFTLIDQFGADAVRWYMFASAPPICSRM